MSPMELVAGASWFILYAASVFAAIRLVPRQSPALLAVAAQLAGRRIAAETRLRPRAIYLPRSRQHAQRLVEQRRLQLLRFDIGGASRGILWRLGSPQLRQQLGSSYLRKIK